MRISLYKLTPKNLGRVFLAVLILPLSSSWVRGQAQAQLSPAEQIIALDQRAIEKYPEKFQVYNDLAAGFVRRARETSDSTHFTQAEEALQTSFRFQPNNFPGRKIQVSILLGRHEFAQALEKAKALNRQAPDDVLVYGYVADADVELGNYREAEEEAQWMLDLRPGNIPGLLRGAALRKVYGDFDGAMDFLQQAYQQTPPSEIEDLAWLLTQTAELQLMTGKTEAAEALLQQALQLFPGYSYSLENLASVRTAQKRYVEAVDLLRQRNRNFPTLESDYRLAETLERAGRKNDAKDLYAEFEREARRQIEKSDNDNRDLILYYVDRAHNSSEALRIARLEVARRHDVYTLDAYGWALCANGQFQEARNQMEKVLAVGIRDATFFYHAGIISFKLNDRAPAVRYLKLSLELNPFSEVSNAAREVLDSLAPAAARYRDQ